MGYSTFVSGLTHGDEKRAFPGCTLFTTMASDGFNLIDAGGEMVHRWLPPERTKAYYATGLPNGNLLAQCTDGTEAGGTGGGRASVVVELDWDSRVVWRYDNSVLHHDHHRRENGNTILITFDRLDRETSAALAGGDPGIPGGEILSENLIEVTPDGAIAWQWRAHEHLDRQIDRFQPERGEQWLHCNAVEELPDGNILASFNTLSKVVIIDKASGDVSWRLNPGTTSSQHNPTMLANGNILMFDNGSRRNYSRILEIRPADQQIAWEYAGNPRDCFFSQNISGAQRLPNGNTLVCEGRSARLFEVTPDKEVVWEYLSPFTVDNQGQVSRAVFRAHRYAVDSPFIRNRV